MLNVLATGLAAAPGSKGDGYLTLDGKRMPLLMVQSLEEMLHTYLTQNEAALESWETMTLKARGEAVEVPPTMCKKSAGKVRC